MRGPCACTEGLDSSRGMWMIHTPSQWIGSVVLPTSRTLYAACRVPVLGWLACRTHVIGEALKGGEWCRMLRLVLQVPPNP